MATDFDKRKILSALCHGAIFFSASVVSVGIPIAILLVSDDQVVKDNAKESLNFHFNVWLYGIIVAFLCLLLIGWLLVPILFLFNLILPILAIVKVLDDPYQVYHYPFIFRLLK
ncbi:MAG: DUF4870 domain-containing protein [Gomphosphaeria aponina SAG 52.96 = DSM 107014]|uniref:DUF4870 domain-containing protein n=1 Tax=Gomphosphaeria aponina SAG 52.96 = DSM 107014 TaxID=1521640 RepID=A0A941GUE1_9CHRO|nr:DUF4870 domain-containing protein [Gomphosphaeria aponina SAG 52.96 = DSM 107014]